MISSNHDWLPDWPFTINELTITQDLELAGLEAVLILIWVFVLGRVLLRPVLQLAAGTRRYPEIFTATGILLVLGTAWLTDWTGLSMALGAFLGGLLLADSRYRHQIVADNQPFRGLLLGLFFMSVAMSVNCCLLGRQGIQVAGLVGICCCSRRCSCMGYAGLPDARIPNLRV